MIDTQRLVETPEGVDLHLVPAGPVARAEAWIVDMCLRGAIIMMVMFVIAPLGIVGFGLFSLSWFAITWLYFLLWEVLGGGATPGKRALKLKVVHDDGTPVGWPASIIRNLLRSVDCLPVGYAAGFVSMLVARDFRRLGDLAAGTLVIHAEAAPSDLVLPHADPLTPPVALAVEERRAIVEYALRIRMLTPERATKLAALLSGLTGGGDGVAVLKGYATWIVGRR